MKTTLCVAIDWFAEILIWLLIARALLSWVAYGTKSDIIRNIYAFTYNMTEPFVDPIRRAMSRFNTGMIDFSILISYLAIRLGAMLLITIIQAI